MTTVATQGVEEAAVFPDGKTDGQSAFIALPPGSLHVNDVHLLGKLVALLTAFWLGALHAFEPGHAKGVMAAFFIMGRRRLSDAFALGVIVTVAHTFSVLLLGLVVWLFATGYSVDQLESRSELLGGLLVLGFGLWMCFRLRRQGELFRPATHEHEHDCPYPHRHDDQGDASLRQLFVVGLACGLVPCPQGLSLLPVAMGTGSLALSIWLVLAFSLGIGAVVTGLGVLVCKAQSLADRIFGGLDRYARQIRLAGALLVLVLGIVLTLRAALDWAGL